MWPRSNSSSLASQRLHFVSNSKILSLNKKWKVFNFISHQENEDENHVIPLRTQHNGWKKDNAKYRLRSMEELEHSHCWKAWNQYNDWQQFASIY